MPTIEYAFAELIDLDIIQGVIDGFFKVTNIPPSITDINGDIILTVGFKSICADFHRVHPITKEKCIQSDITLSKELNDIGGYACYKCLNGLVDVAVPITIDGKHMANLFIGQFFMDEAPEKDFFRQQAERYGFDQQNYMTALEDIPIFSTKQVEEAVNFLKQIAQLIGELGLTQKRLVSFNEKLEEKVKKRTCQLDKEIEERKRALAEFEAIFNNSSVAIILVKGDRIIHKANERFESMSGYTREEAIGKDTSIAFASIEEYQNFGKKVFPLLAKGEIVKVEQQLRGKNGKSIWSYINGKAINPPNLEDGIIWIFDDISERKELEALKDDVDRIMRHDLKVPLNGIVGLSQSLLLDDNLTYEQRKDLKMIEESGYRMNDQINQSLELYKIETGSYKHSAVDADMGTCLRKVLRDLSCKAATKQLHFKILVRGIPQEETKPIFAKADPMLSHTMFLNLMDNAVEAAPDTTTITIAMDEDGEDHVVISIHNQGAVPLSIRDTFFDKYVTHGKTTGTGLGTYTGKLIAEAQNGSIEMNSDDGETTITIRLPR